MDSFTPPSGYLTTVEQVLWQDKIYAGDWHAIGAVVEFSIGEVVFPTQVDIRVTVTDSPSNWGPYTAPISMNEPPVPPPGLPHPLHYRGWWPYHTIHLANTISTVDACDASQVGQFVIGGGADRTAFANNDPFYGSIPGNPGLYGVNADYTFPVNNKCEENRNVYCYLRARNVGPEGKFWGAAAIGGFTNLGVDKIRYTRPTGDPDPLLNLCSLNEGGPISVPAGTIQPVPYVLKFASGGSAEMPVNFMASTFRPNEVYPCS